MEARKGIRRILSIIVIFTIAIIANISNTYEENKKQQNQQLYDNSYEPMDEEITTKNISNTNEILGVFKLEGDSDNIDLIAPDGSVLASGVDPVISQSYMTEGGLHVELEGFILNTVTGQYWQGTISSTKITVDGVSDVRVLYSKEEVEGVNLLCIYTDKQRYTIPDDGTFNILLGDENKGEIAIENDQIVLKIDPIAYQIVLSDNSQAKYAKSYIEIIEPKLSTVTNKYTMAIQEFQANPIMIDQDGTVIFDRVYDIVTSSSDLIIVDRIGGHYLFNTNTGEKLEYYRMMYFVDVYIDGVLQKEQGICFLENGSGKNWKLKFQTKTYHAPEVTSVLSTQEDTSFEIGSGNAVEIDIKN